MTFDGNNQETVLCPKCQSANNAREIILCDSSEGQEYRILKEKEKDGTHKNKVVKEQRCGKEWSTSLDRYIDKEREIDRQNNRYHEKVIDTKTGEVIHQCDEPLSQHQGHGSDK